MVAALILWSYLAVILYLYGMSAAWLVKGQRAGPGLWGVSLPLVLLIGMVCLGTLAAVLSLFIGLNWLAALLLAAGGVLLYIIVRPPFPWTLKKPGAGEWLAIALLLLAALIVLENATHPTANPDTNLYHAQSIHWAETYPAVPGLGNLNGRLAYNSDWLLLNAATSFAFLGLQSFHLIAGLLFLLCVLYFGDGILKVAHQPFFLSNWLKLLFLPLAFRILAGEISSPGTDLPVILLTWVLMVLIAEYLETRVVMRANAGVPEGSNESSLQATLIAVLPAFIVTLKLSAAPLMLVTVWMFAGMLRDHKPRLAWASALLALVILLPWFARSVIQSGYLVFPYSGLDLFHFDWKIPASYVRSVREGVIGWARLPDKDWKDAVKMPLAVWLPAWFAQQTLNQRLMIVAALLSPLSLLFRQVRRYAVPLLINYLGIWFWLLSAPNLRFGYGFLLAGLAFMAAGVLVFLLQRIRGLRARQVSLGAGALLLLVLAYTLINSFEARQPGEAADPASGLPDVPHRALPRGQPHSLMRLRIQAMWLRSLPLRSGRSARGPAAWSQLSGWFLFDQVEQEGESAAAEQPLIG